MPKLLAFFPCDRVITDIHDNSVSAINIFASVQVERPEKKRATKASKPGKRETSQLKWTAFTLWKLSAEELGTEFSQLLHLTAPDGKRLFSAPCQFTASKLNHRVTIQINGFPAGPEGRFTLTVSIGTSAEDAKTQDPVGTFPIDLTISVKPQAEKSTTARHSKKRARAVH